LDDLVEIDQLGLGLFELFGLQLVLLFQVLDLDDDLVLLLVDDALLDFLG